MAELLTGSEFAGCRIDGVAGRGGMGIVYQATQLSLGRPVALKLLAADRAADPEFRERFQRESRLAASIDHPNIVPVYAAGEEAGSLYLVMRLVRGTDLQELIKHSGPLDPARAAAIVAQVAAALDAAHAAGLVHRDVKPANVLLDGEYAYLSDFGLTRLLGSDTTITETGRWMGTVDYASPEQLRGTRCDARSDVYALGCVLHAALTGEPPFPRQTVPAAMHAHLHDEPPRPSAAGAPRALDRVLARALAKSPDDRYPSAGDLGRAAVAAARGDDITESERSVARGAAAPAATAHGNGGRDPWDAAVTTVLRPQEPATVALGQREPETVVLAGSEPETVWLHGPEPDTTALPHPARRPARRRPVRRFASIVGVLLVAGAVGGALAALGLVGGSPLRTAAATGPVGDGEVQAVVRRFADAYATEDGAGLGATLTRDVQRVDPGGGQSGRRPVVAEYERQFGSQATTAYELEDLSIQGGDVGRAEGRYTVRRDGAAAFGGRIVFNVVRERGEPRIGLIAATPE